MKFKVDVDCTPDEARAFFGLPDVKPLQETLLPEVEERDLQLGYSGLRPKLVPPGGKGIADFVITRDPAVPQAIHLVGIESPGLTAAPSIAEHVSQLVAETFD